MTNRLLAVLCAPLVFVFACSGAIPDSSSENDDSAESAQKKHKGDGGTIGDCDDAGGPHPGYDAGVDGAPPSDDAGIPFPGYDAGTDAGGPFPGYDAGIDASR